MARCEVSAKTQISKSIFRVLLSFNLGDWLFGDLNFLVIGDWNLVILRENITGGRPLGRALAALRSTAARSEEEDTLGGSPGSFILNYGGTR